MRLIDADKLKKDVLDLQDCYNGFSDTYDKACIIGVIDEQPSAQPEVMYYPQVDGITPSVIVQPERKKGKWIEIPDEVFASTYRCSECGAEPLFDGSEYALSNYCPNCGADMRSKE